MTLEEAAQALRDAEQRKRDALARYNAAQAEMDAASRADNDAFNAVAAAKRQLYEIASPEPK